MRRESRAARRAGFTLIELLTVIAILALLAALVAAGIGRIRGAQQAKVNDQTLTKLQLALDKQWKAFCDKCRDDRREFAGRQNSTTDFGRLVTFCDNDTDRAEAMWMYLNLRRNIPHTFQEARNPVVLKDASNAVIIALPASATFSQVPNKATGSPNEESAALLYLILSQGSRGTNSSTDDATQGAQMTVSIPGTGDYPAFRDAYANPIAFRRFFQNADMNSPPYVRQGLTITDPLDPRGIIKFWRNTTNLARARQAVFLDQPQPAGTAADFDGLNKMPTVFSAGPDKNIDLSGNTDDAYGYRVLRQGNRGD